MVEALLPPSGIDLKPEVQSGLRTDRLTMWTKAQYRQYLQSPEWKTRREETLRHYQHRCAVCDLRARQVHHRTYKRLGQEKPRDLVALCVLCHLLMHAIWGAIGSQSTRYEHKLRRQARAEWCHYDLSFRRPVLLAVALKRYRKHREQIAEVAVRCGYSINSLPRLVGAPRRNQDLVQLYV